MPAPDRSPQTWDPGDVLNRTEPMSFHDHRGLIVDPVAVAAIFDDLMGQFPALDASSGAARNGPGGVASIGGLAAGIQVQLVDLHGAPFASIPGGPGVEKRNGATPSGTPDANGLIQPAAGEVLAGNGAAAAARLRLGWATGGTMGAGPLALPALPGGIALGRQFLRAFVTDLDWHILGNRSASTVRGVPGEDNKMPADLQPQVRDGVTVDYPCRRAGPLGGIGADRAAHRRRTRVAAGLRGGTADRRRRRSAARDRGARPLADLPSARHRDRFPGGQHSRPLTGATAIWTAAADVVVTLAAGAVPDGASVRIFSQQFKLIDCDRRGAVLCAR